MHAVFIVFVIRGASSHYIILSRPHFTRLRKISKLSILLTGFFSQGGKNLACTRERRIQRVAFVPRHTREALTRGPAPRLLLACLCPPCPSRQRHVCCSVVAPRPTADPVRLLWSIRGGGGGASCPRPTPPRGPVPARAPVRPRPPATMSGTYQRVPATDAASVDCGAAALPTRTATAPPPGNRRRRVSRSVAVQAALAAAIGVVAAPTALAGGGPLTPSFSPTHWRAVAWLPAASAASVLVTAAVRGAAAATAPPPPPPGARRRAARTAAAVVAWLAATAALACATVAAVGSALNAGAWAVAHVEGAPWGDAHPAASVYYAPDSIVHPRSLWHMAFSTMYAAKPSATEMLIGGHAPVGCAVEDALGCRGWETGDCVPPANRQPTGLASASAGAENDVVSVWACPICDRHVATSAACAGVLRGPAGTLQTQPASACPAVGAENVDARVPGCRGPAVAVAEAAVPGSIAAAVGASAADHLFGNRPLSWTLGWWWALAAGQGGVWLLCFFV